MDPESSLNGADVRQVWLKHKWLPIPVEAEDVLARLLGSLRFRFRI